MRHIESGGELNPHRLKKYPLALYIHLLTRRAGKNIIYLGFTRSAPCRAASPPSWLLLVTFYSLAPVYLYTIGNGNLHAPFCALLAVLVSSSTLLPRGSVSTDSTRSLQYILTICNCFALATPSPCPQASAELVHHNGQCSRFRLFAYSRHL